MIKLLISIIIFLSSLNALVINSVSDTYSFNDFKIFEENKNNLAIYDIIKNKKIFKESKKTNIGIKKHPIWTYSKISNKTLIPQNLIFANPRAGIDYMDVYVLENEKIVNNYHLGDMNPLYNRTIQSRKSNFDLEILPNQEYEIFIKYKSFGAIDINLNVYNQQFYANLVKNESLKSGLIIGVVFLICIIVLYIIIYFPNTATILFFFILIGSVLTQFSVAGVLYEMGLNSYLNTIISWSFGNISAAFIGLFPIYYFKLHTILPKTTIALKILCGLLILLSISFLFYPLKNDLLYLAPVANIQFFVISLVLIFIAINLYKKRVNGHKIYALGNGIFLFTVLYFIMGLLGIVPTNFMFYYALTIGTFVNILCLGYLIFSNLIKIKKEKDEAVILLNEYSKLSSVGQSMINLSHQWKEPLNHIYYAINNIQAAIEFKDPNLDKIIDKSLNQIKDTANYMTNTGKNFLNIYQDNSQEEIINLKTVIDYVLILFEKQISSQNINIIIDIHNNISLYTNKYLLSNIIMAIVENSIKISKERDVKNPYLKIKSTKSNDKIEIKIVDNAGGIKISPIESIFEKDITNSKSTGLGLYLVKSILTLKLNGNISVKNTLDGVEFNLTIELKSI